MEDSVIPRTYLPLRGSTWSAGTKENVFRMPPEQGMYMMKLLSIFDSFYVDKVYDCTFLLSIVSDVYQKKVFNGVREVIAGTDRCVYCKMQGSFDG